MKRWIHSITETTTYRNKRNPNKYLEVHRDGYGHQSVKQYMHWDETDVTNPTGDGIFHRWRKDNIDELLEDYEPVESSYDPTVADEYVVKIWYESDEPMRGLPSASEEVFFTVANSPSAAIEQVKREWTGPIDRIEIVDINPDDMDEDDYMEIPFN